MRENKPSAKVGHRGLKRVRTHANILACCRRMIARGNIRPETDAIAQAAHCSPRTIFLHFGSVSSLYFEALDDVETSGAVLSHVLGEDWRGAGIPERCLTRIACAIVAGPQSSRGSRTFESSGSWSSRSSADLRVGRPQSAGRPEDARGDSGRVRTSLAGKGRG